MAIIFCTTSFTLLIAGEEVQRNCWSTIENLGLFLD